MTPEEVAKKHCYNGHNPEMCSLLADVRNLVSDEREKAAAYLERAAMSWTFPIEAKTLEEMAATIRRGIETNVTKG